MYSSHYYELFPYKCSFISSPKLTTTRECEDDEATGIILIENCPDINYAKKVVNLCMDYMTKIIEPLVSGHFKIVYFDRNFDSGTCSSVDTDQLPNYIWPVINDINKINEVNGTKYISITYIKQKYLHTHN